MFDIFTDTDNTSTNKEKEKKAEEKKAEEKAEEDSLFYFIQHKLQLQILKY